MRENTHVHQALRKRLETKAQITSITFKSNLELNERNKVENHERESGDVADDYEPYKESVKQNNDNVVLW